MHMTTLQTLESQLSENLTLLSDKLDLLIRQKEPETLKALADLIAAWNILALLVAAEAKAKKARLPFILEPGESIVDSLYEYATQQFPRAIAGKVQP